MKVICKTAEDNCPKRLNICCGTCEYAATCGWCCDTIENYSNCQDAEHINEIMQFESAVPDVIKSMTTLLQAKQALDEQEKQLKQKLLEAMEAFGVKSFETDLIKMTYVAPTTRSTIDSTRLKKEHPDIAAQYTKTSNVSASVRVTVK